MDPAAIFGDLRFGGADGHAGVLVKSAEHGCEEMIPIRSTGRETGASLFKERWLLISSGLENPTQMRFAPYDDMTETH
jgi:hypothetical protein